VEGALAGRGPGGWDDDRLATLCWAYLIRSDSGPADRVVDRAGLGPERPPGGDCRGWGAALEHGAREAAGLSASGNGLGWRESDRGAMDLT
jgi:hypothetical protein